MCLGKTTTSKRGLLLQPLNESLISVRSEHFLAPVNSYLELVLQKSPKITKMMHIQRSIASCLTDKIQAYLAHLWDVHISLSVQSFFELHSLVL